jgi:hypothetical protein
MEPYIFFVFFSAIVLPTGEVKTLSQHVTECPSEEIVKQMHVPKLNRGELSQTVLARKRWFLLKRVRQFA